MIIRLMCVNMVNSETKRAGADKRKGYKVMHPVTCNHTHDRKIQGKVAVTIRVLLKELTRLRVITSSYASYVAAFTNLIKASIAGYVFPNHVIIKRLIGEDFL